MKVNDTITLPEIDGYSMEVVAISKKVTSRGNDETLTSGL